jgi:hypothetical protein
MNIAISSIQIFLPLLFLTDPFIQFTSWPVCQLIPGYNLKGNLLKNILKYDAKRFANSNYVVFLKDSGPCQLVESNIKKQFRQKT